MKKLEAVTQEQWNEVCEFNRNLVESFLSDSVEDSGVLKLPDTEVVCGWLRDCSSPTYG